MTPEDKKLVVQMCLLGVLVLAALAAFIAVVAVLDPPAEYSVAVSIGDDLDDDGTAAPAPAPAPASGYGYDPAPSFELTIHVKNPSRLFRVCVNAGATAAVSCNGTAVAGGAVPQFCAGRRGQREAVASVRGVDDVHRAAVGGLRREGAVVDVAVRVPHVHAEHRLVYVQDRILACTGVKIGGGLSPYTSTDP